MLKSKLFCWVGNGGEADVMNEETENAYPTNNLVEMLADRVRVDETEGKSEHRRMCEKAKTYGSERTTVVCAHGKRRRPWASWGTARASARRVDHILLD